MITYLFLAQHIGCVQSCVMAQTTMEQLVHYQLGNLEEKCISVEGSDVENND